MKDFSDREFFYAYLTKYLDGYLVGPERQRFDSVIKAESYQKLTEKFQIRRGVLQDHLLRVHLPDSASKNIRDLLEDQENRFKTEMTKIDLIEKSEFVSDLFRRIVLAGIAIGIVAIAIYYFKPQSSGAFPTLEYIGYETLALIEDSERLDFSSGSASEVAEFVKSAPGLDFTPFVLNTFGDGWLLKGASLIDYELKKVLVIKYQHPQSGDFLFHFLFAGTFNDLPKAERAQIRGLDYQVYSNDRLNFLAWESSGKTLSLLVSRRGAVELAQFARAGTQ